MPKLVGILINDLRELKMKVLRESPYKEEYIFLVRAGPWQADHSDVTLYSSCAIFQCFAMQQAIHA